MQFISPAGSTDNAQDTAMLDKVRKLFAKAESVAGTPEADVFNEKAYALLAKYGIDEAAARATANTGPAPVVTADFYLVGKYRTEQRYLLASIALAMHCKLLQISGPDAREVLIGVEAHVERVRILFAMLMPQMLAGAARVKPANPNASTSTYRRSWMRGFYCAVADKLKGAEVTAADNSTAGASLMLLDDARRAERGVQDFVSGRGTRLKSARRLKGRHDFEAAERGRAAGSRVDVGGAAVRGARALTS